MASGTLALVILATGLGTFLFRLSFIHLSDRLALPGVVRRGLRYVPAAVLAALVAPAVLRPESALRRAKWIFPLCRWAPRADRSW
ncbi:AzlD domain-containing protein [Thiohalorhabdus denitrificans]|uniref:Branched-chain amino acid transport protein (AzlD) n=1 Tax=Thiohalorhabdus denitrificans TaxID=381306 RepID=A0A1G5EXG4_9GAMM|nr:AzlD domain-containing protein [Thiohalorhabdus denitrificans]SCY31669.1 Branched-chain amino acid transport protein (AzlD) [Thiohalorhabdus denitrificans]